MQAGSGITVMLGDEAACIWLIAADGITERPQRFFHRLRHRANTAGAIAIAQNKFWPRPLVPVTRSGWHGMTIDQDSGAKLPVQAAKQAAQGAVVGLVEGLDSPQRVV